MRKVNYKEKGITLIALVITIIILLILAGVTLTTALSQNGLFERAKYAGEKYKESEADEAEKLGEVEEEIDKIIDGENPPSGGIGSSEIAENLKQYQGKYVDIGLDTNDDGNTANDWELFYVTEDRIFLIAADYVPVSKLTEWGVVRSGTLDNNGFKESNSSYKYNVCWPDEPTSFLELPTEPDNFLELVMHNGYDLEKNKDNHNSMAASHLLNKDSWKGIKEVAKEKDNIDFVIGGPTIEMWCAAWREAVEEDTNGFVALEATPHISENGYYVSSEGNEDQLLLYVNGKGSESLTSDEYTALVTNYGTFFPHVGGGGWNSCFGYWLASPSGSYYENLMYINNEGYLGYSGVSYNLFRCAPCSFSNT